ncbi:hypothetical protein AJ80_09699, partial [Polytolypa hystricis UAMH7299]
IKQRWIEEKSSSRKKIKLYNTWLPEMKEWIGGTKTDSWVAVDIAFINTAAYYRYIKKEESVTHFTSLNKINCFIKEKKSERKAIAGTEN